MRGFDCNGFIEPKLLYFEVNDTEFSENNADGYTSHMLKVILATVFLLPCLTLASTDTDAPVLNSVSLSASSLDVSLGDKTLTVTMDLTEASGLQLSGNSFVVLTHSTTGANVNLLDCSYTDPTLTCSRVFSAADAAGEWTINYIYLKDTPGSVKTYYPEDNVPGYDSVFSLSGGNTDF